MNPEEATALRNRVSYLEQLVLQHMKGDRFFFHRPIMSGPDGLRIHTDATAKISFHNKTPIAQWSSGTGRGDVTSDTGLAAKRSTQYDGNLGGTGYSVGDLVAFLKTRGDIAQ